jgi:hypothetical protein
MNAGTINANAVAAGFLYASGSNSAAIGTVNVNGTGTLVVNGTMTLSSVVVTTGGAMTLGQGTLNINGGVVQANAIAAGGGTSTINMSAGTLGVTNSAGAASAPLTAVNAANSTLQLNLNGAAIATNVDAVTVTASGVNSIAVAAVNNLATATTFPVIAYTTLNGSVAANFAPGSLPAGYRGLLVNNTAQKRVDLRLGPAPATPPSFSHAAFSGASLALSGTNGPPGWTYYVLASTNIALPLNQWAFIATNTFDSAGNFSFSATPNAGTPQTFYQLKLQ